LLKRKEQIVTGAYGKKRMIDGEMYADRGIATRHRAMNGENDGGIVVLLLVANKGHKAETDKLRSNLHGFLATDDRGEITEPLT